MHTRPHIVIITTHDTGRHLGCYGVPTVHTPHIDALAADGVRFSDMYATAPICSPSRASLLTGQWPQRHGLIGLAGARWGCTMTHPEHHLASVLRRAGYRTALFGMHHEAERHETLAFDQANPGAESESACPGYAMRAARAFDRWIDGALAGDQPLYAQIGFFETHTPYGHGGVLPDDSKGVWVPPYALHEEARKDFGRLSGVIKDAENDASLQRHLAGLQGSIRAADEAVGVILAALRRAGVERDTLVLFNADHGPELPRAKWTLQDPGLAIAFIARWPAIGACGGRVCDWMLSNADFVPTLAEMTGLELEHVVDGVSFAGAMRGEECGWLGLKSSESPVHAQTYPRGAEGTEPDSSMTLGPREALLAAMHYGDVRCLRTRKYKLLKCLKFGVDRTPTGYRTRYPFELFDLEKDPLELTDVSNDPAHATDFAALCARFWRWLEELDDPILRTPLRTPT